MILAGDIGGTHTRLALFAPEEGSLRIVTEQRFASRNHAGLEGIVLPFLSAQPQRIRHACFGIAGPVLHGRVETPNLPWVIDAADLAQALGLGNVSLINDLEANAFGLAALGPSDLVVLNAGSPQGGGNAAVIAAGTGLGEAGLYWDGQRHRPFACEGGHCDFAPRTTLEAELLVWLVARLEVNHVSYERVLSGPGLHNIYMFLRETGRGKEQAPVAEDMQRVDPPSVISRAALRGQCDLCRQALEMFVEIYGAEAGNLALKIMATGGVFVGGGIAPRILPALQDPRFLEAFLSKGRMRPVLQSIPVQVVMNENTALMGAARCASIEAGLL